jgi:hypothetical protein
MSVIIAENSVNTIQNVWDAIFSRGDEMPEFIGFKCDHCKKIIEQPRDVYRLEMKGENWEQPDPAGGHSDTMRNVKKLGFCEGCARQIVRSLQAIEGKQ